MLQPESKSFQSPSPSQVRTGALIVAVLTLIAMGRLCANDFTWWDDQRTVHHNPWLQPPTLQTLTHYWSTPAYGLYIPVTYTAWAAIAKFALVPKDQYGIALNPYLFHSANVFCHLLAVLVAYRILVILQADLFAAIGGALLFGIYPLQVEAVAWVSGLKDVLSGLLALIALWLYVSFSLSDARWRASYLRFVLASIAFILAMLAKPSVMALPLAAMAIDRWCIGREWRKILPKIAGWIVIAVPIAAVARSAQIATSTQLPSVWWRPLIALDSLAFYLGKLVWPVNLIIDYGRNPTNVFAHGWCYWDWIVPVSLTIILIAGARRRPMLLAAGTIFLAGSLPVLGFTPAIFQFFSTTTDHYLYLSMFGPAVALSWALSAWPTLPFRFTTALILVVMIGLTMRQGEYWRNDITLCLHDTQVNPESFAGFINLGGSYGRMHDSRRSIAAFEDAVRANPNYPIAWSELAAALRDAGRSNEAIASARRSLDLQVEYPELRTSWFEDNQLLGEMLFKTARFREAIPYLQTASDLRSDDRNLARELLEAKTRASHQPG